MGEFKILFTCGKPTSRNSFAKARDLLGTAIAFNLVIMLLGYLVLLVDPEELISRRYPRFSLVRKTMNAGKIQSKHDTLSFQKICTHLPVWNNIVLLYLWS